MSIINELILKSAKLTLLLREYKQSVFYEKCKYHVVGDDKSGLERFILINIDESRMVIYGTPDEIKRHVTSRNINQDEIYNIESLYI